MSQWRGAQLAIFATALMGCAESTAPVPTPDVEPPADTTVAPSTPAAELIDYAPGPMAMRRLTRGQYVTTVRAIFGDDVEVLVPTEVDLPLEGLHSVGASVT